MRWLIFALGLSAASAQVFTYRQFTNYVRTNALGAAGTNGWIMLGSCQQELRYQVLYCRNRAALTNLTRTNR